MPKLRKDTKTKKKQKQEKYNAENEIIIGVTTVNKEKRVDNKRSTRANHDNKNKRKTSKGKNKKQKHSLKKSKIDYQIDKIEEISKEETIRKSNRKRNIICFIICLLILIAGAIFIMTTPQFYIKEIEIDGNSKNSVDTYISLTKIDLNTTNIFAISKNSIIKNIKENPYVESVEIKRKLPNKLHIDIQERKVDYQIKYNDKYIYLSRQGYILEINEKNDEIIKLVGLNTINDEIKEGERLKNEDLSKLDIVLKIVNQFKYNSIENVITVIDVSNKTNIQIELDNGEKKVYLGDASSLSERILWLKTVLDKEGKNKGEIFINGNMNDSKVYFKPTKD